MIITETFTQKIFGQTVTKMFNIVRNKINFIEKIQGVGVSKIIDGISGKYVLPSDEKGYIDESERGHYYKFEMEDGSEVNIRIDEATNSLKFDFKTEQGKLKGLRETVLNYIDYEFDNKYEARLESKES